MTIEDFLEEIVGNIFDEYDVEVKEVEQLGDDTFIVSGMLTLYEVKELLKVELPMISQLGSIPPEGEQPEIEYSGVLFKVVEVDRKRIVRVKVCRDKEADEC